ncbi:hypothetical protein FHG87_015774 [Trinorchestia longiramus]|nr:hypothetical protein FHG87_015774 [Trinorchestia longiramus]
MESSESHNSKLLHSLSTDLAQIVSVDCSSKRTELSKEIIAATHQVENNNCIIDEIITNHKNVNERLPAILSQYKSLEQLFEPLDKLGRLVDRVRADVTRLEAAVATAEQRLLGEQPSLTQRILQPVLRHTRLFFQKLDSDTVNDNNIASSGSFQIFDPSDYIVASSLTDQSASSTLPLTHPSPPIEPAVEAFCLDNLSSLRISDFPVSSDAGFGVTEAHPNNTSDSTTDKLVLRRGRHFLLLSFGITIIAGGFSLLDNFPLLHSFSVGLIKTKP